MDNLNSPADRSAIDSDQLNLLSIYHYIIGGLMILMSCMFMAVIVMGMDMLQSSPPDPRRGLIFIVLGAIGNILGWILSVLIMLSGYDIAKRRNRGFTLVISAFNLLLFPFGTLLAVCTFIVLRRDSIRLLYHSGDAKC